jgi:hypothetical protein
MTEKSPDFMEILEVGVRDVLTNKKASMKDRIDAINAGTKLMLIKHKITDTSGESGSFFK